ncbi:hypothetical protein GQ42DRAFT_5535 [Ramicandelaber brevisporus]|nr:hypothetical protein GQ42DRAFT_5535 [Ramicandelaber brevisporus]
MTGESVGGNGDAPPPRSTPQTPGATSAPSGLARSPISFELTPSGQQVAIPTVSALVKGYFDNYIRADMLACYVTAGDDEEAAKQLLLLIKTINLYVKEFAEDCAGYEYAVAPEDAASGNACDRAFINMLDRMLSDCKILVMHSTCGRARQITMDAALLRPTWHQVSAEIMDSLSRFDGKEREMRELNELTWAGNEKCIRKLLPALRLMMSKANVLAKDLDTIIVQKMIGRVSDVVVRNNLMNVISNKGYTDSKQMLDAIEVFIKSKKEVFNYLDELAHLSKKSSTAAVDAAMITEVFSAEFIEEARNAPHSEVFLNGVQEGIKRAKELSRAGALKTNTQGEGKSNKSYKSGNFKCYRCKENHSLKSCSWYTGLSKTQQQEVDKLVDGVHAEMAQLRREKINHKLSNF